MPPPPPSSSSSPVQTAIQVLIHPRTRETPLLDKVAFLKRKGIASQDIHTAVRAVDPQAAQAPELYAALYPSPHQGYNDRSTTAGWIVMGSMLAAVVGFMGW